MFSCTANAATINFNSLETALADPTNKNAMMYAAWTGWMTQVYEYNMPFVEIANGPTDEAIRRFKMTIGDTNYQFSNEFKNKQYTNSWNTPANGEYAILGMTTPGISFTTSVENGADTLVVDFGPGGLLPGQTVRFQVDIDMDPGSQGTLMFADYTSVFFTAGGGSDTTGNSEVTFEFINDQSASATLPNFDVPHAVSVTTPRPYSDMQMIDILPGLDLDGGPVIPEPGTALLGSLALAGAWSVNRRRA